MALTFFTVTGQYRPVTADTVADSDYDPQTDAPITATVTFTPVLETGDVILASPEQTILVPSPIVGKIDTDGLVKLRSQPDSGGSGSYAPVRLLADTAVLGLSTPLFYDVKFTGVTFNGRPGVINGFRFQAPNADLEIDLVTVSKVPGIPATGIVKLAPGGVRMVGSDLVFSFGGQDIPDPVSMAHVTGPTGPAGPTGPVGPVGQSGAVGAKGDTGERGERGERGEPGAGLSITGTVPTYADLPALTAGDAGAAYFVAADGLLYVWTGSVWPAEGHGAQFKGDKGERGDTGAAGRDGIDGATGAVGPAGRDGVDGAVGPAGRDGVDGAPGRDGINGAVGPTGPQGDTGPAGPTRTDLVLGSENGVAHSLTLWTGTQAQYDAIPVANHRTVYVVTP